MPLQCLWINIMYGILKSSVNTGADNELASVFSTPLSIVSNQPEFSSDTLSLVRMVSKQGVQRWELEAEIAPSDSPAEHLISSVLMGGHTPVYVRMPQPYRREKQQYTVPVICAASASAGSGVVIVSGNSVARGSFIKFANHNKVYLVTECIEDASEFELMLYPALRKPVPLSTSVLYADRVTAVMKYDTNVIKGIRYSDGVLSSPGTVNLLEAL